MRDAGTTDALTQALTVPGGTQGWPAARWSLALSQARQSGLLGSLNARLGAAPRPEQARSVLDAAEALAERRHARMQRELVHLAEALEPLDLPWVVLKGTAYMARGLPVSRGRTFSDIDLLVERAHLKRFEDALLVAGWTPDPHTDAHDDRFYREWSHEVPPVVHILRRSTVDLHHALAPPLGRYPVDTSQLLAAAPVLPGYRQLRTLCDTDLVLHSALHLVVSGEFDRGLRDLLDIDGLIRHFSVAEPAFEHQLCARAQVLGLADVLALVQRQRQAVLGVARAPQPTVSAGAALELAVLQPLYAQALRPQHASCAPWWRRLGEKLLYARAHTLRLPLRLLLPHLWHKAWRPKPATSTAPPRATLGG